MEQYFGHNYPLPRKELFGRNNGDEQAGKYVLNLYFYKNELVPIYHSIMQKQLAGFNWSFTQTYAQK